MFKHKKQRSFSLCVAITEGSFEDKWRHFICIWLLQGHGSRAVFIIINVFLFRLLYRVGQPFFLLYPFLGKTAAKLDYYLDLHKIYTNLRLQFLLALNNVLLCIILYYIQSPSIHLFGPWVNLGQVANLSQSSSQYRSSTIFSEHVIILNRLAFIILVDPLLLETVTPLTSL